MDKQNKTITELTPDQMDKVSGGTGSDEFGGYNAEPFYNGNNTDINKFVECSKSPLGIHDWIINSLKSEKCRYCNTVRPNNMINQ